MLINGDVHVYIQKNSDCFHRTCMNLDHSCNEDCDLIGQEEVSISHRHL